MTKYSDKMKSPGFHLFLQKFIKDGRYIDTHSSFEAVRSLGNAAWNNLEKDKREEYRIQSEKLGNNEVERKLAALIDEFKLIERAERQKMILAGEKIQDFLLTSFDESSKWNSQIFVIGHVNYLVKVKNDFYANEVGLVKFSIEQGIIDTLHFNLSCFLPVGHEREARSRAEDTHQLPVKNASKFGISKGEAREKINKFLNEENLRYIFTLNEVKGYDLDAARDLFDKIMDDDFYVIPLEKLLSGFHTIIKHVSLEYKLVQDILLNGNPWESYDIGCEYHAEKASSKFCSLAKARRWAYHIFKIILPQQMLYPGTYSPILTD